MVFGENSIYSIKNIFVFVLFVILLFIGFWRLPYSPATWYDEGINVGIARSLLTDGVFSLKVAPNEFVETRQFLITTNYPVLFPVALSLKFFGINFTAARVTSVIYLFLFALLAYIAAQKWYGYNAAIATLALIVSFLPFYGNGKSALGEVAGLFFLLTGLLFLENNNFKKIFLAGLFLGLSVATKPFFLLVLPALLAGEVYRFFAKEKRRKVLEYFILSAGLFIPILIWFITINPNFNFGNIMTAFQYYSNSYADKTNIVELMFLNFKRFFTETTPLHFFTLFVVSAAMLIRGVYKKNISVSEVVLFVFVCLNFLWYLKTPGWYRYFFPAHLLLFLFFPAGLKKMFSKKIAFAIIIFFIALQVFILISKRNEPLYFATEARDMVSYVNDNLPKESSVMAVNAPSVAFLLTGFESYQYLRINPQLVFAPADVKKNIENLTADYVIAGSLVDDDQLMNVLEDKYKEVKTIGHYALYERVY